MIRVMNMMKAIAVFAFLFCCLPLWSAERPNILFIFTDDHATQAISAYGGMFDDIAPTPHLDRLAAEGMLFRKCYVTNSICGPARAMVRAANDVRRNNSGHHWSQLRRADRPKPPSEAAIVSAAEGPGRSRSAAGRRAASRRSHVGCAKFSVMASRLPPPTRGPRSTRARHPRRSVALRRT